MALNPVAVEASKTYPMSGVYSFGRGLFAREDLPGTRTTYRALHRLGADALVLSQLKAWEGALGVVPPEHDGRFLSPQFATFHAHQDRLDVRFLGWWCRQSSVWEALRRRSRGMGARRDSVSPERFLSLDISLPPLVEQRRIVARIDEFRTKIDQARGLTEAAAALSDALCRSFLFSRESERWPRTPMRALVTRREPDTVVSPSEEYPFAGVFCFGRGIFKAGRKMGATFGYRVLTRLRSGDFVYPKLMAWEGALGVVPPECDGLFVSPEFPVFEIDTSTVLPETLDVFFRTPSVWPRLAGVSTGTNVRRRRLHPRAFLAFEFPLPPMDVQLQLKATRLRLQEAAALRGSGGEALDALMPSILGKAFRGEL